jgi:hypothetical protein
MDAKVHFLVLSRMMHNLPAFELQNMQQMHKALIYRGLHDTEIQPKKARWYSGNRGHGADVSRTGR